MASSLLSIMWFKPILRAGADSPYCEGQVCCKNGGSPLLTGSSIIELYSALPAAVTKARQCPLIVFYILF